MLKSMTGFAKTEEEFPEGRLYGEARGLNNRYLEIGIKLPKSDYGHEQKLREAVKRLVKRGKIDISFKWEKANDQANSPKINEAAVMNYVAIAKALKEAYDIKGHLTVENIMAFRDVFTYEEGNSTTEEMFLSTCETLLIKLNEEKATEGKFIERDLLGRLETITGHVFEIERRWPLAIREHEARLREKICEITGAPAVDEARILQEMALYMERLDITEEIVRLRGHIDLFRSSMNAGEPVGRKLDFIIQEMVRETNTIASKSSDLFINERAIEIKVEIEKMREQVQNVE